MTWDLYIQLLRLLRPKYRKAPWVQFIYALLWPVKVLIDRLGNHRQEMVERVSITSQYLALDYYLKQLFGPSVYIEHAVRFPRLVIFRSVRRRRSPMIYRAAMNRRSPMIYRSGSISANQVDFRVYYSVTSLPNLAQMNAVLARYSHAGASWVLIPY